MARQGDEAGRRWTTFERVAAQRPPAYGYDARRGAAAFAPIIGTIGGFVVAAVVFLFTFHHAATRHARTLLGLATGLLVLGLICCVMAAFVFAAIGAERKLTANLTAAVLYAGAVAAVGIVAIVAAFEVLSDVYLRDARLLFAMITVGIELAAAVLVALAIGDAWVALPTTPLSGQPLARSQADAYREARRYSAAVVAGVTLGAILYFSGVRVAPTTAAIRVFVGVGVAITVGATVRALFRTMHPLDGRHRSIERLEANAVLGTLTGYLVAIMLFLP